jgi:hypothetical protein
VHGDVAKNFESGWQVVAQAFENFEFTILAFIKVKRWKKVRKNDARLLRSEFVRYGFMNKGDSTFTLRIRAGLTVRVVASAVWMEMTARLCACE